MIIGVIRGNSKVTKAFRLSESRLSVRARSARLQRVGSAYANPLKSSPSAPGRLANWLQSASAEVWVKFLLALLGLGLAFASALLTVSRDAGNVWATVILASMSLVLATLVGLVTVPYLARRVAVERLRESFDYDVTRVGVIYALVTLVIGIAALNTGNNLLYIVVAAMLGAILVSGVVSAWVLRWLELDVRLPSMFSRAVPLEDAL